MATYAELLTIATTSDVFKQKVRVACVIAAETVRVEVGNTNHALRLSWAKAVFANPEVEGNRMVWAVLAQNAAFTASQLTNASDATVLAAVMTAIDVFAS